MITYYQKTITTRRLKTIPEFRIGSWVYIENPTEEEFDELESKLGLDRGLLVDATDQYEVPRVEESAGITYIFSRVPYEENGEIHTAPILLGVGESFVFTVCKRKFDFLNVFHEGRLEFTTTQKVRFLLQILAEIDSAYAKFITLINKEVRRLSARLSGTIENSDIIRFVNFESILNDLLDALVPTNVALSKLLSGKFLKLHEEDKEYAEDVFLSNGQLVDLCRSNIRAIMNIRNAYSTIMTNNLNRVIKLLTALTIIFMLPNIIVGALGMNVPIPLQDSSQAFWWVLLIAGILTAGALWLFKRKELL